MADKERKDGRADGTPILGRLGAERWIAVRQKTGAGPMQPKTRRGTRAERERAAAADG